MRGDRAADRQGGRQLRGPGGAAVRRHQVLVRADQRRRVRGDRAPRRPASPDLPAAAAAARHLRRPDQGDVPGHPAAGVRLQPGLAAARARLRCGRSPGGERIHAGHRPARQAEAGRRADRTVAGRARLPERRQGGGRGAAHPRARASADRAGGPGPQAHHRRDDQAHEPGGAGGTTRRAPRS